ncbi:MAG: glycine zipper 2TM domain-containing protein [Proteobacteria bacterium]|nr:glycine zipper 2TM domain-containing protein [Pseudomonadota bacterium]
MENQTAPRTRLHPLVATAAVAVTIASAVGIAAITGMLPGSAAKHAEPSLIAQAPAVSAPPAPQQSVPVAVPEPVTKAAPKPKPVVHHQAANVPPAPRPEPVQVAQAPAPGTYPPVPPDYRPAPAQVAAARPMCFDCGIVEAMREVERKGEGTGLGAVAGGIGGLILGHQVGGGAGNKIATVLGAAGGAYAGHQIEKNARATKSYEVSVIMEDGSRRTVTLASAPTWRAGDHVRVVNGTLEPDNR